MEKIEIEIMYVVGSESRMYEPGTNYYHTDCADPGIDWKVYSKNSALRELFNEFIENKSKEIIKILEDEQD